MNRYSLSHLSDDVLLASLGALVASHREDTVTMLVHLGEVDARRLYLPAACSSMYEYCVREMRFSEDEACTRIRAARTGRDFPQVFTALADGRLSLTAVVLLSKSLSRENVDELLDAAANKSCQEVRELLAARVPKPDVPASVRPLIEAATDSDNLLTCEPESSPVLKRVDLPVAPASVRPLSPESYAIQCTFSREEHELLRYAQALMGHAIPTGDIKKALVEGLRDLVQRLEKTKFAATSRPRASRGSANPGTRYVPAEVKRAVWERDEGRCTFVESGGQRCQARTMLEFDHVQAFARGGEATVEGMRLLCRAHNQYAAEQTFGSGFMRTKREVARLAAEERRSRAAERHTRAAPLDPTELDVTPWLRKLGVRAEDARRLAERDEVRAGSTLEARLRTALKCTVEGRSVARSP
jgi:hypothetical protein